MGRYYTLLLLSALLVSSMSAPAPPDTDTGGEENDQRLINPRLNPISKRNFVQPLIKKFSNFLEDLPLDQLTLLESAKDISEFQGILGALIHDDNKGGESVLDMIDQLKNRYTMLHGIVRGLIAKTVKSNPVSGNEVSSQKERLHPVSRTEEPSKEPFSQSYGDVKSGEPSPSKLSMEDYQLSETNQVIRNFTNLLDDLPLSQLILLKGKKDLSEIEKMVEEFIDDNKKSEVNSQFFHMSNIFKGGYNLYETVLQFVLRRKIAKTESYNGADLTSPEPTASPKPTDLEKLPKMAGPNHPPEGQSHSGEIEQLIHKFARIFDAMTLDDLKLLEETIGDKKGLSEFEGLFGVLADDASEDVYSMLDQLKGHYTLLHGILRGKISRKEKLSPVSNIPGTKEPSKEPPSQSNGQSSSQNEVKSQLDGAIEKIVEQQLMAAVKILPVEDLEKLQSVLAEGNDPSQILKALQPAFPKLTDELIKVAIKYPSELKAVIEQIFFENKLLAATATAQPSELYEAKKEDFDVMEEEAEEVEKPTNSGSPQEETTYYGDHEPRPWNNGYIYKEEEDVMADEESTDYYRPEQVNEEEENVMVVEDEAQDHYILQWPTNYDSRPEQEPAGSGWRHGSWHCFMIFLVITTLLGVGFFCCQSKDQVGGHKKASIPNSTDSKEQTLCIYKYKPLKSVSSII